MFRDIAQGFRVAIRSPNLRFRAGPAFQIGQRFGRIARNPYFIAALEALALAIGLCGIAAGIVAIYLLLHVI